MPNNKTWLLVADASRARIFEFHKALLFKDASPQQLSLVAEYTHAASRMKNAELVSDKAGEFGTGAFADTISPKELEAEQFAIQLTEHLSSAKNKHTFRDLILISPPGFMGLLNKHLNKELNENCQTIEKDYSQDDVKSLIKKLMTHL